MSPPNLKDGWPTQQLFDVPIHALRMDEVLSIIDEVIADAAGGLSASARAGELPVAPRGLLIGVVNAAKIVSMRRNASLRESVLSSDMILADGVSVIWAGRLLGRPLPERVPGIDLMIRMLERANERGYRVYCLGATEEVSAVVAARIGRDYPGVLLAGRHHGYFTAEQEEQTAADIKAANPDILFVAMSPPKKEIFLGKWAHKLNVPVCHGVGGAFDVMAGKVKRAPALWQRLGMEWLYRIVQEPRRMWRRYLVTNTLFLGMLARELLKRRRVPRR